jgi:hypothetical protein
VEKCSWIIKEAEEENCLRIGSHVHSPDAGTPVSPEELYTF